MFLVNVEKCLRMFDTVYVSSDSELILAVAEQAGAKPILRGKELCGNTPNIMVYQHAVKKMGDIDGFVAVQSNSPTIKPHLIWDIKDLMERGYDEIMTCHPDYSIYGSVWAIGVDKLAKYGDMYHPRPDILMIDRSIDIHTQEDLDKALKQYER